MLNTLDSMILTTAIKQYHKRAVYSTMDISDTEPELFQQESDSESGVALRTNLFLMSLILRGRGRIVRASMI